MKARGIYTNFLDMKELYKLFRVFKIGVFPITQALNYINRQISMQTQPIINSFDRQIFESRVIQWKEVI